MLKKIVSLQNIGRFQTCKPSGDVELRRLNLIFAGNGLGKTTLCAIIRSVQSGDARYLTERQTRGQSDAPAAMIRIDGGHLNFGSSGWNQTMPGIAVYDGEFIHDNIYAGDFIDHDQKKHLYRVMIGEKGVKLARKVDDLDEQSRQVAKDIRQEKKAVEAFIPSGLTLKAFLELKAQDGIDEAISAKAAEVDALQRASEIKSKSSLQKILLPKLPDTFRSVLATRLEDVAADVEQAVQDHIQHSTKGATVSWLSQGLQYATENACPFCGQSTNDVPVVKAYSVLFGEKYRAVKDDIAQLVADIDSQIGEAAVLRADKTKSNETLAEFWRQFVPVELPALSFDLDLQPILDNLHKLAAQLVRQKASAVLEPITPGEEFDALESQYTAAKTGIDTYNAAVDVANALIGKQKAATEAGNLDEEKWTLQRLRAIKVRHDEKAAEACLEYQKAELRKTHIELEKENAKTELDEYSQDIFGTYRRRINEMLESFGADFRIGEISPSYSGGHPSSSFAIIINDEHVDIGDSKTPRGTPSFRSTLSSGDRSSLALAFFIAQLENLPTLDDTIVVFDDPFTSQDRSRRTYTQQLICRKAEKAKQVIVASHDPHFLKLIWDSVPGNEMKTLQIARIGKTCTITEWDIEEETRCSYLKDIAELKSFLTDGTTGNLRDVARKIRPILEGHLQLRFPHQFRENEWLGNFISKIRDADAASPLSEVQGDPLNEVEDINDYSKKYHHDQNSGVHVEPIDDAELGVYVRKTLKFVGSC